MTDPTYIYRIRANAYGLQAEVATYDPDRWGDEGGGARFGCDANVSDLAAKS